MKNLGSSTHPATKSTRQVLPKIINDAQEKNNESSGMIGVRTKDHSDYLVRDGGSVSLNNLKIDEEPSLL